MSTRAVWTGDLRRRRLPPQRSDSFRKKYMKQSTQRAVCSGFASSNVKKGLKLGSSVMKVSGM